MNFRLEPWEISPENEEGTEVSVEFGPVEWKGQNTMVSARWALMSYTTRAYVRFHQSDINYVVIRNKRVVRFERTNSKILGRVARQAIAENEFQLGRIFYLEGEFCLATPTEMFWIKRSSKREETVFALPDEVREKSSSRVFDWLRQQWMQLDSEVRFSWDWNQKSLEQQQQYFAKIVPRWRELSELMSAIATAYQLPPGQKWTLNYADVHNHAPEL